MKCGAQYVLWAYTVTIGQLLDFCIPTEHDTIFLQNMGGENMDRNSNGIKKERLKLKFSIYDVAKKSGLTPGYISNLERGERNNPSKDVMEKIAESLDKTVAEIFYPYE